MSRWCQSTSTLRAFNEYGRKYASNTRRLTGVEALTHLPRRHLYHINPVNVALGDQDVKIPTELVLGPEKTRVTSTQQLSKNNDRGLPFLANRKLDGKDTEVPLTSSASISPRQRPENSRVTPPLSNSALTTDTSTLVNFRGRVARARRSRKGELDLGISIEHQRPLQAADIPISDSLHKQYRAVQDTTNDPDVHLPYFDLLVSVSKPEYFARVVECLCGFLERAPDPHPRFPAFLWNLLIVHGSKFDGELKQHILRTITHRLDMDTHSQKSAFSDSMTTPGLTPEIIRQEAIAISQLSAAFAHTVFPCYNPHYPFPSLNWWATQQARKVLAPELALDVRWNNLMLLACSSSPKDVEVQYNPSATSSLGSASILWRTALMLETIARRLPRDKYGFGSQCGKVQGVVRPLWKSFTGAELASQHPDIIRAYVSTFLRLAAKSFDEQMKGECYRLSQQLGLWNYSMTDHRSTRVQVVDILAAYGTAYIACEGRDWRGLYTTISSVLPDLSWRTNVTNVLIRWYLSENVETAYDLYIHSLETGFSISQPTLAALLRELVNQQRWDIITMFLEHPSTTRENLELLFGQSLVIFQTERYRYANVRYVRLLALTAFRLYEHVPPPRKLKYPIRYFLSMMVWTQNAAGMVRLLEIFRRTVPNFFTPRWMRGLGLDLIRRRDVPNALKLLQVFGGGGEGRKLEKSLESIRQQLTFKFFKMGARKAALKLTKGRKTQVESLSRREALTHVALSTLPSPVYYQHIRRIVSQAKGHGPTVREAVSLLLKAKRPWSARKLYAQSRDTLDVKTRTVIGNMIIHSPMLHKEFCHARLVRRVLKIKDVLIREYGFVPDRTTLNIIIKSILRWKTMVDAPKVRRLFDNMVHEGYPVPAQFRRATAYAHGHGHGVPFGSPHGPFDSLTISSLPENMSFSKHVRPMYKMFIKAFYVRGDIEAAKTMVGILKEVEAVEMREFEKRCKARREGVIRKRSREEAARLRKQGAKGV